MPPLAGTRPAHAFIGIGRLVVGGLVALRPVSGVFPAVCRPSSRPSGRSWTDRRCKHNAGPPRGGVSPRRGPTHRRIPLSLADSENPLKNGRSPLHLGLLSLRRGGMRTEVGFRCGLFAGYGSKVLCDAFVTSNEAIVTPFVLPLWGLFSRKVLLFRGLRQNWGILGKIGGYCPVLVEIVFGGS